MSTSIPKVALHLVSLVGATKIMDDIIKNNVVILTTADKLKVRVGSLVLGSMLAEGVVNHLNRQIEYVVAWNEERKTKEAEKEAATS